MILFFRDRFRKFNVYAFDTILIHAIDSKKYIVIGDDNLILFRQVT